MEEMRLNAPVTYQKFMADQAQLEIETKNYVEQKAGTVYVIPIVFHILHNGGAENISDAQIYDAVAILNRDFRRLNADANNVHTPFQGMPTDVEIEFRLATIAPDGTTCFKGITRTQSTLTNATQSNQGGTQLTTAFNNNDVWQGTWPHSKYLNVLVANNIGGAAGYTYNPSSGGVNFNSIWMLHNYTGSIGTSSVYSSRALTHEVGHWLNLAHTWGNGNIGTCGSDNVADTPTTNGSEGVCVLTKVSCDGTVDNVENYMEYSYCSKMFTPGQVTRMRAAVTSSTGSRSSLWTTANLNSTGAIANPPICKAEFSTPKRVVCVGETVQFNDASYNTVTGWSWSFSGGTPSTSTAQNPTVVYNTPGTYQVSLIASQGANTRTETKTAYITVLNTVSTLPFHEGFESYTTMANATGIWFVENPDGNNKFEITNTAGHTGAKSVKLQNHGQSAGSIDELISSPVDLSNETLGDVTLSFRYAYRKIATANTDLLRVYFSSDCGSIWAQRAIRSSNQMIQGVSNPTVTNAWTPTLTDWKTVHIPFNSATYQAYLTSNFRYKFQFTGNGGNNVYIDDINIYNGPESDEIVYAGIKDAENVMKDISLFPNPNDGELNISFSLESTQQVTLKVMDISGKELRSTVITGNTGENLVLMDNSDFASGMYFIQLHTATSNKTLQFIKK
jgi:PKD repeat protein